MASFIKTSLDMKDFNSSDIELSLENNFNLEMNFDPFKYIFSEGRFLEDVFTSANIFGSKFS